MKNKIKDEAFNKKAKRLREVIMIASRSYACLLSGKFPEYENVEFNEKGMRGKFKGFNVIIEIDEEEAEKPKISLVSGLK